MKFLIRVTDEAKKNGLIPQYSKVAFQSHGRIIRIGTVVESNLENGQVVVKADSGLGLTFLEQLGFNQQLLLTISRSDYQEVVHFK